MKCLSVLYFACILALLLGCSEGAVSFNISVLTSQSPPFVIIDKNATGNDAFSGFSIDVLEYLAKRTGFNYTLVDVGSVANIVSQVGEGGAVIGHGAVTITGDRMGCLDFTTPFFRSRLQLLTTKKDETDSLLLLRPFSWELWVALIFLMVLSAHILVVFEWKDNVKMFWKKGYAHAFKESIWWAFCSFFSSYQASRIQTTAGRIYAGAWYVTKMLIITAYTAGLASLITVSSITNNQASVENLNGMRIGGVHGTTSETYLQQSAGVPIIFQSIAQMFQSLETGSIKGILYEGPTLEWFLQHKMASPNKFYLDPTSLQEEYYGIALPYYKPIEEELRPALNKAIVELMRSSYYQDLNDRWMSSSVSETDSKYKILTLQEIGLTLSVLIGASVLLAIFADMHKRWSRKRSLKKYRDALARGEEASLAQNKNYRWKRPFLLNDDDQVDWEEIEYKKSRMRNDKFGNAQEE